MPKIVLVAGMSQCPPVMDADYIGVDHGAVTCLEHGIPMLAAVGDFDSVTSEERCQIEKATTLIQLPSHKNETDSEVAIDYAVKHGYDDIILFGSLGGRLDHELANLHLMLYRDLPLTLMSEHNVVSVLKPGVHHVKKIFRYLSFLALEDSCISESGVAYPLDHQELSVRDIYSVSNEFLGEEAVITLHSGRMLMMQCDDANQRL